MKFISSDQLLLIGFGTIIFLSLFLISPLVQFFDISYTFAFFLCFIPFAIMLAIGLMLISNKNWYKELTDYSFYRFKEVYELYQKEVIKDKKTLNRFSDDYYAENQLISYPQDSQGNPIISEYNKKNKILNQIIGLLNNRVDLVNKYFYKDDFRYPDYLNLINEYNTTVIKQENLQSENIIEQEQPVLNNNEEKLLKVRAEILKYESEEKQPKHIGQRMFGILLCENIFSGKNPNERLEAWKSFTDLDNKPEDSYLLHPFGNKNMTSPKRHAKYVNDLVEFFYLIDLDISKSIKTAISDKEINPEDIKSYISQ